MNFKNGNVSQLNVQKMFTFTATILISEFFMKLLLFWLIKAFHMIMEHIYIASIEISLINQIPHFYKPHLFTVITQLDLLNMFDVKQIVTHSTPYHTFFDHLFYSLISYWCNDYAR